MLESTRNTSTLAATTSTTRSFKAAMNSIRPRCAKLPGVANDDEVQRIESALRNEGWAEHASLARELQTWARLSVEVNAYTSGIDAYTNDLCSRDYLAEMSARASTGLRRALDERMTSVDQTFRAATVEDTDVSLGRFYRIESRDGWWWRRRPSTGPLSDRLTSND